MVETISNLDEIDYTYPPDSYQGKLNQGRVILSIVKGTVPLNRSIGIDPNLLDKPITIIQRGIFVDLHRQFKEFAPDLTLSSVSTDPTDDGLRIICEVEVI